MIIIQTPYSMTACRFKHIPHLNFSHQVYIFVKYMTNQLFILLRSTKTQSYQSPTKIHKWHLVTCSIVNSSTRSPWFRHIPIQLLLGSFYFDRYQVVEKTVKIVVSFFMPIFKCFVSVSHWLLNGRCFV